MAGRLLVSSCIDAINAHETRCKVLDERNILYFPNCKGRMNTRADERKNLKPDFLICHKGKWGILEVDGNRSILQLGLFKIISGIGYSWRTA